MRLKLAKVKWFSGLFCLIALLTLAGCSEERRTKVVDYPIGKPFMYGNKVVLKGSGTKDELKKLSTDLNNYWDDSARVRKEQRYLLGYRIKNPPVYDSLNMIRSINYMNAYLNSQGYYYASFKDSIHKDTLGDQIRVNATITINQGKNISIDSVGYQLDDSTLQQLAIQRMGESDIKKGSPYSKQLISAELDRMIGIYRRNGYYKLIREDLYAEIDTTDISLIELTLDPFKQAELIAASARKRRQNPTWNVTIKKRPTTDSSKLTQFKVANIYYYPETKITDVIDSLTTAKGFKEEQHGDNYMRYQVGKFKYQPLKEHTFLSKGEHFNEESYFKTLNTMGQIGAWQQVDGKIIERDKDSLDLYFYLVPALKQNFTVDLEGSRNTGDIGAGNLFGISTNLSYKNRNVWKRAVQSITNFRTGVELNLNLGNNNSNQQLVQTFNISAGHTFAFPKIIQPFKNWKALSSVDNKRTLLSFNAAYVDRRDYYKLRSILGSWGYEWKKVQRRSDDTWLFKPINVELYSLDTLPGLDTLFLKNPFLRNSFNTGNIYSQSLSYTKTINAANRKSHFIRLGLEETGLIFGLFKGLRNDIYRYIKVEAEYRQTKKWEKSEMAYRAFAGMGYNYGNYPGNKEISTLPFFKQFAVGGPYSMRAWGLRQLGLGSSNTYDSILTSSFRDRYGDMVLEFNAEYRFTMATIAGVKIGSALYSDIGNIWNLKKDPTDPKASFSLSNLANDLAIGVGTGLRLDFSYFLIRLDFAYKVKDPMRTVNGGWMSIKNFNWTDIRSNGREVSNYALQLGIGLPF